MPVPTSNPLKAEIVDGVLEKADPLTYMRVIEHKVHLRRPIGHDNYIFLSIEEQLDDSTLTSLETIFTLNNVVHYFVVFAGKSSID